MIMPRLILSLSLSMLGVISCVTVSAQSLDDARRAFADGDYAQAAPALMQAADKEPRNTQLHHQAGIALMHTGDFENSLKYLAKGTNESKVAMAEIAFMRYRFDEAEDLLDKYNAAQKRSRKQPSEEAERLAERLATGRSMLDRVEKITIVDSLIVDREDFFKAYRLSAPSGSIQAPDVLPSGMSAANPTTVYLTESADRMIWSAPDKDENFTLMQTIRLADGEWESPTALGSALNEGGDANYPFLMPDGVTLYFANDGENSLGGYDIFISHFNGTEFLQPQNVGMPYNSPYDDYLLAIDEVTGAGWWATDRNRLGDKITIYRFIPSELRINYPADTPGLEQLALINSVAQTQDGSTDYSVIAEKFDHAADAAPEAKQQMCFALPDGRIITSITGFRSTEARRLAGRYLDATVRLAALERETELSRCELSRGKRSAESKIASAEAEMPQLRETIAKLANDIIKAEIR